MTVLSFLFKNKTLILVGLLLSYIGFIQYKNHTLKTQIARQLVDISVLETQIASEQTKTNLFKNKIDEVSDKLKSTTLLLSERQVIIEKLEKDRSALNAKLKEYEIDIVSMKQAEEFINQVFQQSVECLEAASGKDDTLCID